ncbi:MAG: hypothetical protein R3C49_17560 [Planctomycetaceae bacterium]
MMSDSMLPESFEQLAESRRHWLDEVLRPWCQRACQKDLRQAELEWLDLAGRVDVKATLWTWAWERFPVLTHPEMAGLNETHPVTVTFTDGRTAQGYPDSRASVRGTLVLMNAHNGGVEVLGPFSIDDIQTVTAADCNLQSGG